MKSQEMSRADDPQTAARLTMLNEWKDKNGTGMSHGRQASEIITLCEANKATPTGKDYLNKGLRDAVLAIMPPQHSLKPDAQALGTWLRSQKERRVGKLRFCNKPATGHTPTIWWVEEG